MKTLNIILTGVLVAIMQLTTPVLAEEKSDVFRARFAATRNSTMNLHFTKSDTIDLTPYLNTRAPIYSLSVDATIEQPREASFTRIVLEDSEGHDHLVLECDRFRNDTSVVSLCGFCQETALLFGITPSRLKCYVAGNARLTLTAIHVTDQHPQRDLEQAFEKQKKQHKELRRKQSAIIVGSINDYIQHHEMRWQAGVTDKALQEYADCNQEGIGDAYLNNMRYYIGGIYEVGERNSNQMRYNSPFVDNFDWTNRHGRSWRTPIKDQLQNGHCGLFAAVGVAESLAKLYYNDTVNLDLSEQFMYYYYVQASGGYMNTTPYGFMNFLLTDSIIDDISMSFNPNGWGPNTQRPVGAESVKLTGLKSYSRGSDSNAFQDSIKSALIKYGPGFWGVEGSAAPMIHGVQPTRHMMTLIGYNKDISSGNTCYIFKNSTGSMSPDSIFQLIYNDASYMTDAYFGTGVIQRTKGNGGAVCEDRDGDGYFFWGLGDTPPVALPSWAQQEEDADDSNYYIGSYSDDYGHTNAIYPNSTPWNITSTVYVSSDSFIDKNIYIKNHGQLIINSELHCLPGISIYIEHGGRLTINGGKLINPMLYFYQGGHLVIQNNGELIPLNEIGYGCFDLPTGASMDIYGGTIKASNVNI